MSLESGSTIESLNLNNPNSSDSVSEGAGHIKLIKGVLKNIFPGVGGQGYNIPILAKESELNNLVGLGRNLSAWMLGMEDADNVLNGRCNTLDATTATLTSDMTTAKADIISLDARVDVYDADAPNHVKFSDFSSNTQQDASRALISIKLPNNISLQYGWFTLGSPDQQLSFVNPLFTWAFAPIVVASPYLSTNRIITLDNFTQYNFDAHMKNPSSGAGVTGTFHMIAIGVRE